jgi:predicted RNA-binding Zn ribbon-like protein
VAFGYIAGEACLDFVNTVDWRLSRTRRTELLCTYADLLEWAAGLLSESRRRQIATLSRAEPAKAAAVLVLARKLREAIERAVTTGAGAKPPSDDDIEAINRVLRQSQGNRVLGVSDGRVGWGWHPRTPSLDEPLWPVAYSAAELLTSDRLRRINLCEDGECGWLFLDSSRNRRRKWCSMESCGSRNKARRYYRRQKSADVVA